MSPEDRARLDQEERDAEVRACRWPVPTPRPCPATCARDTHPLFLSLAHTVAQAHEENKRLMLKKGMGTYAAKRMSKQGNSKGVGGRGRGRQGGKGGAGRGGGASKKYEVE